MSKACALQNLLEAAKGDCYEANGRHIFDNYVSNRKAKDITLIHGIAILSDAAGEMAGLEFGHCWLEQGDTVLDFSNGKEIKMSKGLYYILGGILKIIPQFDKKGKLTGVKEEKREQHKYTVAQVFKNIAKYKIWGPWPPFNPPR